jgi:hypothetical protein
MESVSVVGSWREVERWDGTVTVYRVFATHIKEAQAWIFGSGIPPRPVWVGGLETSTLTKFSNYAGF